VNVARVLARWPVDHLAIYLAGGLTGHEHQDMLIKEQVRVHAVEIAQPTRESFSVHEHLSGQDFRFVLPGPTVSPQEVRQLLEVLEANWPQQYLVVSGGVAPGINPSFYAELAVMCKQRGTRMILDSNAEALRQGLLAGVFLVKPSRRELEGVVGHPLSTSEQVLAAARSLIQSGQAQVVAVSMGEEGAIWVQADCAYQARALEVEIKTTIGAGDSFVGAMIAALVQGEMMSKVFAYAMAGGAAALLNPGTSLCQKEEVLRLVDLVKLQAL
jgi:6-phosphofructokinase 2